jgi:hypothetical protein
LRRVRVGGSCGQSKSKVETRAIGYGNSIPLRLGFGKLDDIILASLEKLYIVCYDDRT